MVRQTDTYRPSNHSHGLAYLLQMESDGNNALILAAIHHFSGSCPSSYCTGPSQLISQHHSLGLQLSASFLSRLQNVDRCSKKLMSTSAKTCLCAIPGTGQSTALAKGCKTLLSLCFSLPSPPLPQCVCLDWPAMSSHDQQGHALHTTIYTYTVQIEDDMYMVRQYACSLSNTWMAQMSRGSYPGKNALSKYAKVLQTRHFQEGCPRPALDQMRAGHSFMVGTLTLSTNQLFSIPKNLILL